MDRNNNFYNDTMFNFDMEYTERKKKQRKTFSRLFIALFVYMFSFQIITPAVYLSALYVFKVDPNAAFFTNPIIELLTSSGIQYLIAFPLFLLITLRMDVSEKKEKQKMGLGEFIILFAVAQTAMLAGSVIGSLLNTFIGAFLGKTPTNGVEAIITQTPMWLIFVLMVVVGPIVEEIIFRKVLIDRLSIYGDHTAIVFSAAAFGLMHGNLYQLFYAILVGLVLGYVYTVTRDIKYPIIIHMLLNLLGSVVAIPVQRATEIFNEQLNAYLVSMNFDTVKLVTNGLISTVYTAFQYGMIISGILVLIYRFRRRAIRISTDKESYLPDREILRGGISNIGSILFISISAVFMLLSLF